MVQLATCSGILEGNINSEVATKSLGSHRDQHPAADTLNHRGFIGLCYHWLGSETRSVSERLLESEVRVNMPEVTYGGENGKTVELEVDPELVAVRARRGGSLREGPVQGREVALLNEMDTVLSFPEVGVEVYRRRERLSRSMEELRQELHESPATRFAGRDQRVLRRRSGRDRPAGLRHRKRAVVARRRRVLSPRAGTASG
jgi:hypothetical protein